MHCGQYENNLLLGVEKLPKDQTISFRVTSALKNQVALVEKTTGGSIADMLVLATESIVSFVEKRKHIIMPFSLIPRTELDALECRLKELEAENKKLRSKSAPVPGVAPTGASLPPGRTKVKPR